MRRLETGGEGPRKGPRANWEINTILDLRHWAAQHELPPHVHTVEELVRGTMYVVPLDWTKYPKTDGVVLVCQMGLSWLIQMIAAGIKYALHVDGKHKIHHGKWILLNTGVHSLECSAPYGMRATQLQIVQSFRPVAHFFGKQHESEESMQMVLDAINACVQQLQGYSWFEQGAAPAIGIWDRSTGILAGWRRSLPDVPFATCWPHIARRVRQGEYVGKTNKDKLSEFTKHVNVR